MGKKIASQTTPVNAQKPPGRAVRKTRSGHTRKSGKHKRSPGSRKEEARRHHMRKKTILAELYGNLAIERLRVQRLNAEIGGLRNHVKNLERSLEESRVSAEDLAARCLHVGQALEQRRVHEEDLVARYMCVQARVQEFIDEAAGLLNRTEEESLGQGKADLQSNFTAGDVCVQEPTDAEGLRHGIKSLQQGHLGKHEVRPTIVEENASQADLGNDLFAEHRKRIDSLEESLKHERQWRLYWEGDARDLRGRLAIMRGRPPPRGYLG